MQSARIQDLAQRWTAGAFTLVVSPITLTPGRTLADWASFLLSVRADPGWPRSGAAASPAALALADPYTDGWAVVAQVAGIVAGATLEFGVPAGTLFPGDLRYACDVYGVGGAAGDSPLVPATWVSVFRRAKA